MARLEIGDEQVQALDYAYTIQGWLKSVNSGSLIHDRDPGTDALTASSNLNAHFGADASGFNLSYFDGDYEAIGNNESFLSKFTSTSLGGLESYRNLYNGNISSMVTAIPQNISGGASSQATRYTYDQLNRIKTMDAFESSNMDTATPYDASDITNKYATTYSYDANGNIMTLTRNDDSGTTIDDLTYDYYGPESMYVYDASPTNRLGLYDDSYTDPVLPTYHVESPVLHGVPYYTYDEIGNLKSDLAEEISEIKWTVGGKVKEVIRDVSSTKPNLEFEYDSQGNRISKIVKPNTGGVASGPLDWVITHYVHDASGQLMATYTEDYSSAGEAGDQNYISVIELSGQPIYGSSRLGIDENNYATLTSTFPADIDTNTGFTEPDTTKVNDSYTIALDPGTHGIFHQGDVVISSHSGDVNVLLYSDVDVLIKQDHVADQTLQGGQEHNVIIKDGTVYEIGILGTSVVLNNSSTILTEVTSDVEVVMNYYDPNLYQLRKGNKRYELSNHLGNVLATVSDRKIAKESVTLGELDYYTADVLSYSDYYPFGMEMPGRKLDSQKYRYGFQGHEKDDELKGNSNSYDMGARMYDPRLGRTLSIDPEDQEYPMFSPYTSFGNNPISITDPDGRLLRDSDGNLIVVETGKTDTYFPTVANLDGGVTVVAAVKVREVEIYANDGTPIRAFITDGVLEFGMIQNGDEKTYQALGDADTREALSRSDCSSNCHGVSLANGELTIFSEDISGTFDKNGEFEDVTEDEAEIAVFSKDGESNQHSARKDGDKYIFTDGAEKTRTGNLNSASKKGKYTNPKFKKEIQKRSNWAGGDTSSNPGLRVFKSKEDAEKSNPNDSKQLKP